MINHDDSCEWCHSGYCECYGDAKEQEQRETNCPCSGTEDCMIECGQLERGHCNENVYGSNPGRI